MKGKNGLVIRCLFAGLLLSVLFSASCSKPKGDARNRPAQDGDQGSRDRSSADMTFEEFKKELGAIAFNEWTVTRKALLQRLGQPEKTQVVGSDVYLYYPVNGGTVQIISNCSCWEKGSPQGFRVATPGATPAPKMPQGGELIDWFARNGGKVPAYSIEEKRTGDLSAVIVVLKDGQPVKEFTAKPSTTTASCQSPELTHQLKGDISLDPRKYPSDFIGCYVVRDPAGQILSAYCYSAPVGVTDKPGSANYNRLIDKAKIRAQQKAEEVVAGLKKNYSEKEAEFTSTVKGRQLDARRYIDTEMSAVGFQARDRWIQFIEEREKENTTLITEPIVFINKINMY